MAGIRIQVLLCVGGGLGIAWTNESMDFVSLVQVLEVVLHD